MAFRVKSTTTVNQVSAEKCQLSSLQQEVVNVTSMFIHSMDCLRNDDGKISAKKEVENVI